jgi:GAF domain-containing protein/HAMP domain-containing protein
MNKLTYQPLDSAGETTKRSRNAFIIVLCATAFMTIQLILDIYINPVSGNNLPLITDTILLSLFIISTWLTRRGQVTLGLGLVLGAVYIIIPIINMTFADVGLVSAVAVIVFSLVVATTALPAKWLKPVIIGGFIVAVLVIVIDTLWPGQRISTGDHTFSNISVAILLLIYGVIIARQFANFSLSAKLAIGFVTVGVISVAMVAFANNWFTQTALINVSNQTLSAAAAQTATNIDTFITVNRETVEIEAQLPALVNYLSLPPEQRDPNSPAGLDAIITMRTLNRKDPVHISSYALLDTQGRSIIDTLSPDTGADESHHDYFQIPLKTLQSYVSPVQFSETAESPFLYFSSPIQNANDEIIGVLRVRYSAIVLQQLIEKSAAQAGAGISAILLDEYQIRLANSEDSQLLFKTIAPLDPTTATELQAARRLPSRPVEELSTDLPEFAQQLANAATRTTFSARVHPEHDEENHTDQVAVATLNTQPWRVVFAQTAEVFQIPLQTQTRLTILLAAVIVVMIAVGALGVGQFLASPIVRLTAVATHIAAGDLEAQAPVGTSDEIGRLARAFNGMTAQLRGLIGSLEDQVRDRTAELALSMKVGQRALTIKDLDELLPTITEFIREQFNLYYTQVYFVDDLGRNLILRAGTGTVGQTLIARRHSLPIGPGSIVGRVAAERKSIVVPDTQNSDIHKANPLLPETRCELAVPLILEDRIIGVLDMQANKVNTFTENNMTVFEALATQLAISIDSAQQWALAQEAQRKSEEAVRQLTRQSWTETLAARRKTPGFMYDLSAIMPLSDFGTEAANAETIIQNPKSKIQNGTSVPVVVQNQPIGQLKVQMPPEKNLAEEGQALLAAVAQQLAQKIENLRLLEETRQRATREQIARQITDKIRASRDIETALKIAAAELSKVLSTSKAVIDLKVSRNDDETAR